jgi:hypothetical protein
LAGIFPYNKANLDNLNGLLHFTVDSKFQKQ